MLILGLFLDVLSILVRILVEFVTPIAGFERSLPAVVQSMLPLFCRNDPITAEGTENECFAVVAQVLAVSIRILEL